MARLLKLRRGTTSEHSSFTGAEGEVTIDTTKDTAVVHDGSTAGGRPLLRQDLNNIVAGSVTHAMLEGDAIDGDNIGDDVVNSEHIAAGAIDLEHMSSESVDEDNLHISNAGSNGQFLSKQSGDAGGLTWASASTTDATKMPLAGGTFTGDVTWDNGTNAGKDMIWDESDDTLKLNDDVQISLGSDRDVRLYHTGSHAYINVVTGDLNIRTNSSESAIVCTANAGVATYYDTAKKTETTSTGLDVTGVITADGLDIEDNHVIKVGTGDDLEIYHNATNSYIDNHTGHIYIRNNEDDDDGSNIYIQAKSGEESIVCNDDGAVELYYDNTKEFETTSGGVKLNGYSESVVTALTSASTVTIDFSTANHFSCTMAHNITFANPSTENVGQSGTITLTQDGTGSRTGAWGTQFLWAGGTAPTLTTTASAVARIDYVVVAADKIHCVATLNLAASS